jgi:hypothetical protein
VTPAPAPSPTAGSHTSVGTISRIQARARIVSLSSRRLARRVRVFVRCSNATQLLATVLVHGRVIASASHRGSSSKGFTFKLRAPRRGTILVRIRAVGAGGTVVRTFTVKARRS